MVAINNVEHSSILAAEQGADPATPSAGTRRFFAKADGWYDIDDTGTVTGPFGAGSDGVGHTQTLVESGGAYSVVAGRIFIGPTDPSTLGYTMTDGDQWEDTSA